MEARRKLEEEKGIYEVKRILEVKFRKVRGESTGGLGPV